MMRNIALRTSAAAATARMPSALAPRFAATAAAAPFGARGFAVRATAPVLAPKKEPFTDPDMTHFRHTQTAHPLYEKAGDKPAAGKPAADSKDTWDNPMANAVWSKEELESVNKTHRPPIDVVDTIALYGIKAMRLAFDIISGYLFGRLTPNKILRRVLFLETAAGIPGMVAGTLRHLNSLRRMERDHGWIHTLLEEAENERMHMLVFMKKHKPGLFFRGLVLVTQGVFWNIFFLAYLACPRLCHRFVGYLEEEAVRTYTHIIEVMESTDDKHADVVAMGKKPADDIAIQYWKLPKEATMLDVIYAVRADEANHRDVNHTLASLKRDERNPFVEHKSGSAGAFLQQQNKQ